MSALQMSVSVGSDLVQRVEASDPSMRGHARRVAASCARILRQLRLDTTEVALSLAAARVHDIGKIGIPDAVLRKAGPLTADERALIETHPVRGAEILLRHAGFKEVAEIVLHHHERWDGKGYPWGLRGREIPLGARIIAVADSFDAMTTDRPYRRAMPLERAMAILCVDRGRQWDPSVVDAFLQVLD